MKFRTCLIGLLLTLLFSLGSAGGGVPAFADTALHDYGSAPTSLNLGEAIQPGFADDLLDFKDMTQSTNYCEISLGEYLKYSIDAGAGVGHEILLRQVHRDKQELSSHLGVPGEYLTERYISEPASTGYRSAFGPGRLLAGHFGFYGGRRNCVAYLVHQRCSYLRLRQNTEQTLTLQTS